MCAVPSGRGATAAMSQCPRITVASEATRRRSMYRSRPDGVAPALPFRFPKTCSHSGTVSRPGAREEGAGTQIRSEYVYL